MSQVTNAKQWTKDRWRVGVFLGAPFLLVGAIAAAGGRHTMPDMPREAASQGPCKYSIALRGDVKAFGTHGRNCELGKDGLTMEVTDRDGDFAMCCIDLEEPLDLSGRSKACGKVESKNDEQRVDLKLEVPDSAKQIFVMHETKVSGTKSAAYQMTAIEKKWRPRRLCMAAVGPGPTPNTIRMREVGFSD